MSSSSKLPWVLLLVVAAMAAAFVVGAYVRSRAPEPQVAVKARETPRAAAPAPAPEPVKPEPAPERPAPRRRAAPRPAPAPAPAAPTTGTLHVDSDVPGAEVFIDRVYVGTTPVTAEGVKPGDHRLNVSAKGFEGIAENVDVTPGDRDLTIKFKVVRLDASIDVVHKHAFGSCSGKLVATPEAISYVTDNKSDAFSAPLTSLDEFTVDYLKKNLRIKLKGGRTYNFTDPNGNADHLFVFHRDVEKAIALLKKGYPPAK
jgi:hypothetical protein